VRTTIVFVTHDIDEALFLADRVLVMSHRPGRIIDAFQVPFARRRSAEVLVTPDFGALKHRCLSLLHTKAEDSSLPRLDPLGIQNVG
jgi:NitT/TauT family transport system ATP-binding protein